MKLTTTPQMASRTLIPLAGHASLVLAAFLLVDCSSGSPPPAAAAGQGGAVTVDAGSSDGAVSAATGPEVEGRRRLSVKALAVSGETQRELAVTGPNDQIPIDSTLKLELPALSDVRARLFDEADKAIASNDRMEAGSLIRYTLVPSEPLVPGSRYELVIDGLRSEYPAGKAGELYEIVRFELRAAGEKPAPVSPKTKPKSKRAH